MSTKITELKKTSDFKLLDEAITDVEMDRFFAANHDEVEVKLQEARDSIAQGKYAPLEPLHVFLARARERRKVAH